MVTHQGQEEQGTPVSRVERHRSVQCQISQPVLTLFASILILSLLFGLGGLRLYCLSMEQKLSSLNQRITQAEELRLLQGQELASLLSPSRVYSYAHAKLGMQSPSEILVVQVHSPLKSTVHLASVPSPMRAPWYSNLLNLFVRQASAHD